MSALLRSIRPLSHFVSVGLRTAPTQQRFASKKTKKAKSQKEKNNKQKVVAHDKRLTDARNRSLQQEPGLAEPDDPLKSPMWGLTSVKNRNWVPTTMRRIDAIRLAREQDAAFAAATEDKFNELWAEVTQNWHSIFFQMDGFLEMQDEILIRPTDTDSSGFVSMQSLQGFLRIALHNWLKTVNSVSEVPVWEEMISPSGNYPWMRCFSSILQYGRPLLPHDRIFVRYKLSQEPTYESHNQHHSIRLISSILSATTYREVARSSDLFDFLDHNNDYMTPISKEEFSPLCDELRDVWSSQRRNTRAGFDRVMDNIWTVIRHIELVKSQMVKDEPKSECGSEPRSQIATSDELQEAIDSYRVE